MTIASEISRLQTDKEAMRQAIIDKWVAVAASVSFDDYAACIAAIPTWPKMSCVDMLLVWWGWWSIYNWDWTTSMYWWWGWGWWWVKELISEMIIWDQFNVVVGAWWVRGDVDVDKRWWATCFWSISVSWWGWASSNSDYTWGWVDWWWAWWGADYRYWLKWWWKFSWWDWNARNSGWGWWAWWNWCNWNYDSFKAWDWWLWVWSCISWTLRYYWWWGWWGSYNDRCAVAWCWCHWWGDWWICWRCRWCNATYYGWWWWGWGWNWCQWIVIVRYKTDWSCWINCATWWTKTTSWAYTVHTFTSNWTFTIVS